MNELQQWLLILSITLLLNTVPFFMPPTWVLLTYFHGQGGYEIWQLAAVGALAASIGRATLALGVRSLGMRKLPIRWQSNIQELGDQLEQHRALSLSGFALFMLGPLPSNQMFIAIGIARLPLYVPLAIFAVTRFGGYLFWITTANAVAGSLADTVKPRLGGTASIIAQVVGLLGLVAVMQIDWHRIVVNHRRTEPM